MMFKSRHLQIDFRTATEGIILFTVFEARIAYFLHFDTANSYNPL